MKAFLRWLIAYLDRKFPDKVVVTTAQYQFHLHREVEMKERLLVLEQRVSDLQIAKPSVDLEKMEARVQEMQDEISKFNVAMGFAAPTQKVRAGILER